MNAEFKLSGIGRALLLLLTLRTSSDLVTAQGTSSCRLPENWRGRWFQSGVQQPILISNKFMDTKGGCYENSEDKFLFYEAATNCHRCLVINARHPNVIQYKETQYCEDQDSLENLCSNIPGDAQLYSLFRLDAAPEDCPFRGAPFTFTYNRGYGECKSPVSHVDTCTDSSHLLFRYQACPDVQKTESTAEELECVGHWREGSQDYLVGRVQHRLSVPSHEESYRCFVFEKMTVKGAVVGYRVAQSGDATCTGVNSPSDGARTLTLTKAEPRIGRCMFPYWFHSHRWESLNGKMTLRMSRENSSFHVVADEEDGGALGGGHSGPGLSFMGAGARVDCESGMEVTPEHFALAAVHTVQCKREKVCLHIYRRDEDVVELRMSRFDEDCGLDESRPGTVLTLVNPEGPSRRCPYLGKHAARGMILPEGRVTRHTCTPGPNFNTLLLGCGDDRETLEFYSNCPQEEHSRAYACHGSWEEGETGYLIASPLSRSSTTARRYCFTYKSEPPGGVLSVSASSESCGGRAGRNTWNFNLTVESRCAEAVISGALSPSVHLSVMYLPLVVVVLLLVSLVHSHSTWSIVV